MVEFSRIDGTDPRSVTVENSTTDVQFMGLDKGMIYMTRVAGNNSRGFGNFSEFVNRSTNVDRKLIHNRCCLTFISLLGGEMNQEVECSDD